MSTEQEPAISEVQLQQLTSPKLTLWEVQISGDTFAYFHEGLEAPPTNKITMRDRVTPSTIRTYEPIPIAGGGFEYRAEGSSPRPTLTVANVLGSGTGGLLAGISPLTSNKDLLGKKVYRRTVFLKHTYDNDTSSNPPIEFPIQMYFIDRIVREDPILISFELIAGFDLEGVKLPRRVVTGSSCPWIYTGAAPEVDEKDRIGGCTWSTIGKVSGNNESLGTTLTWYNYINSADEPIVDIARVESSAWTAGSNPNVTQGEVWRTETAPAMNKINPDGSLVEVDAGGDDYWQYTGPNTSAAAAGAPPSDNSSIWRRVRVHSLTYSAGADYFAYSLSRYNTYVKHNNQIWVPTRASQIGTGAAVHNSTPQHNSYWELGDACSKSLKGCALRYRYLNNTWTNDDLISPKQGYQALQFGGFPGSRKFT